MTNVLEEFAPPSRWLSAEDVGDQDINATITGTSRETVRDFKTGEDVVKLAIKMRGASKPLLVNNTNLRTLAKSLGPDDSAWVGRR
jgi:hypothetical protein